MTASCPPPEEGKEMMVASVKHALGGHRAIVVGPATDDQVERLNQFVLRRCLVRSYYALQFLLVVLDRLFTGSGACRESQLVAPRIVPGMAGADRVLTDGKAEEVEPHRSFMEVQGVCDPRFARFQVESHVVQP